MDKTTPVAKGIRTALQAIVGVIIGLVAVVWAVPGVPEAVIAYIRDNLFEILLLVGLPSGVLSYTQNKLGL